MRPDPHEGSGRCRGVLIVCLRLRTGLLAAREADLLEHSRQGVLEEIKGYVKGLCELFKRLALSEVALGDHDLQKIRLDEPLQFLVRNGIALVCLPERFSLAYGLPELANGFSIDPVFLGRKLLEFKFGHVLLFHVLILLVLILYFHDPVLSHPPPFLRSSLRHHLAVDLSFIPVNRYIELADTAPEFLDVRIAVHAGTNDIRILFLYAPRKAAGTGTVAVARLVRQQAPENVHDEFSVPVQAYALRLSVF